MRKLLYLLSLIIPSTFVIAQNNSLVLNGAYIRLNGGTVANPIYLVVNQPQTTGIVRNSGHIHSEGQYNHVRWVTSTNTGNYVFPFGVAGTAADYIPFEFNKTTAGNANLTLSTYSTVAANTPFATPVSSMPQALRSIDRFWDIRSSVAVTANLIFRYRGIENTVATCATDTVKAQYWNNPAGPWSAMIGPGNPGVTAGIGVVGTISGQTYFQPTETVWALTTVTISPTVTASSSVACNGGSTGAATVTTTGGLGGYSYSWSGSASTSSVGTSLGAGTHTVTVTGSNACSRTATVTIAQPAPTTLAVTQTSVTCSANASATITPTGGTPGYTSYVWNPAVSTTNTATGLTAGNFTVTANDLNGCSTTSVFATNVNTIAPTATANVVGAVTCTNSAVTLSVNPSGLGYNWTATNGTVTGVATNQTTTANASPTATFAVLVTNPTNGCTVSVAATPSVNQTPPTATANIVGAVTCTNSAITLSVNPSGMSYNWTATNGTVTGAATNQTTTANSTTTGTFSVLVTNPANGCTVSATASPSVNQTPPTATANIVGVVTCTNSAVTLSVNPSGMAYNWTATNGTVTGSASNQTTTANSTPTGTFTILLTNPANGCTVSATASPSVNQTPPTATANVVGVVTCTNSAVTLSVNPSGMAYNWTATNGTVTGSASNQTTTANSANNGTFAVLVTNPVNGCTVSATASPSVNQTPVTATANVVGVVTCTNSAVTLSVNPSGLSYNWTATNGTITGSASNQTTTANSSSTGTFSVLVTNPANGCTVSATSTPSVNQTPVTATATAAGAVTCTNSAITLSVNASGMNYNWTASNGTITGTTNTQTTTANSNASGSFSVLVTNPTNGCSVTAIVTPSVNQTAPTGTASVAGAVTCTSSAVTLSVNASGMSYSWSATNGTITGTTNTQTTTANSASNGTFAVLVTNPVNGCTVTSVVSPSVNQTAITPTIASPAVLNCTQTSIPLNGTPGTGVTYTWSATTPTNITAGVNSGTATVAGPGVYTLVITNNVNGCPGSQTVNVTQSLTTATLSATSQTAQIVCGTPTVAISGTATPAGSTASWTTSGGSISGSTTNFTAAVSAGTYTLTAYHPSTGCPASMVYTVSPPSALTATLTSNSATLTCNTATATSSVVATSSTAVTYSWSGPGIIGSSSNAAVTGSVAGTYNYTVTNTSSCTALGSFIISPTVAVTPTASSSSTITCLPASSTGTADVNASGAGPFTYTWSGPGITSTNTLSAITATAGGVYSVSVTDAATGCTGSTTVNIAADIAPPSAFTITPGTGTLSCTTPTTQLTVSSTGGVSYTWTAPATGTLLATGSNTAEIIGSGIYTVVATGTNGCTSSAASGTISVAQNTLTPTISASTQTLNFPCATPSVVLSASVNPSASTLTWTTAGGGFTGSTTGTSVAVTQPSTYTLTAFEPSSGCPSSMSFTVIPDVNSPTVTLSSNTGTLTCLTSQLTTTAISNPTTGVSYNWTGPAGGIVGTNTTAAVTASLGGTYVYTVTVNSNSCTTTGSFVVTPDNLPITPSITASSPTISCNTNTTSLNVTIGSPGTFTYSWGGPGIVGSNTLSVATASLGGTYTINVTNTGNGCVGTETITIVADTIAPSGVTVTPTTLTLSCTNPTASLTISASGASSFTWTAPATGTITSGANTATANITGPGMYSVVATATNGCSAPTATVDVSADANQPVLAMSATNLSITCANPTPTISATSTISTTTYSWSSGSTSTVETFTNPGTFTIVATNTANGCATQSVVTIGQNITNPVAAISDATITCAMPTLTIAPSYSPATGLTYTWSGTAGMSGSIANSSVMVISAGSLTVNFIDPLNGCAGSASLNVTGSTQVPTVNIASSSSVGVGCSPSNSTVTLTSNTTPTTGLNYSWSTGDVTSVITVTAGGIYTVTVTDPSNNCSSVDTISITDNTTVPSVSAGANAFIPCGASTYTLGGSSPNPAATYTWVGAGVISGANTSSAVINMPGTYILTVTDSITGCMATDTVDIQNTVVIAGFTADQTSGVAPLTVNFTNTSSGAINYNWSFGNGGVATLTNTSNTYNNGGSFVVTLIASAGPCSDTATITIEVEDGLSLQIPNVFTPNNDGANDLFTITSKGVKEMTLEIFNRWGQKMYESKSGAKASWDGMTNNGTQASSGTYFYFIKAVGYDGTEINKNGPLNLFR